MDMDREGREFKSLATGIEARVAEEFGELKGGPGSGPHPGDKQRSTVVKIANSDSKYDSAEHQLNAIQEALGTKHSEELKIVSEIINSPDNYDSAEHQLNDIKQYLAGKSLKGGAGSGRHKQTWQVVYKNGKGVIARGFKTKEDAQAHQNKLTTPWDSKIVSKHEPVP